MDEAFWFVLGCTAISTAAAVLRWAVIRGPPARRSAVSQETKCPPGSPNAATVAESGANGGNAH
jgi:hypothetical protein